MSAFHSSLFGNHLAEEENAGCCRILLYSNFSVFALIFFLLMSSVASIGLSVISECGISCHQGYKRVHAQFNCA